MNGFLVSARHELLATRRSRTASILVIVFVALVLASAVIGWITTRTVTDVYEQIRAAGMTSAPNPFSGASPLYFARNSAIYVVLIGCLMAIVLGTEAGLRDRRMRTSDLVLTRPVSAVSRLLGQFAGLGIVVLVALAVSLAASWVVIAAITGGPLSADETLRIVGFGGISWVLLMAFVGAGILGGVHSRHETAALLAPILVWSAITFVLPQVGTAARPIALLNPVPSVAATGGGFDLASAITGPLAITEQYKRVGAYLLQDPSASGSAALAVMILLTVLIGMFAVVGVTSRRSLRRALDD
ncbi:MAG: ABC transporter permease subunit [Actinomycetales bacterium]|nr:ABC transporter permease subunit [Actinomycetales bacterium]